jgi:TM2 domain-containing membrane protein YozV
MNFYWNTCILIILFSINSFCQVNGDSLKILKKQFESFEYQKVITRANQLLIRKDTISKANLKEIYRMKGISHFSINQDDSARYSFRQILKLDSTYNLDSSKTSPKIVAFFNEIKNNFRKEQTEIRKLEAAKRDTVYIPQYVRNVDSEDNLKHAIAQSIIFPGWGHFHQGYTVKGWIFTTLTLATLSSTIYFIYDTNKRKNEYLNQTNVSQILTKYNSYNTAFHKRNISIFALAAVWLYTQIDLLFISNDSHNKISTVYMPRMNYDGLRGIQLNYQISF